MSWNSLALEIVDKYGNLSIESFKRLINNTCQYDDIHALVPILDIYRYCKIFVLNINGFYLVI
jgi:hypothetical protein